MKKLTFLVPFPEKSMNAAFLQAFGQMAEYMNARGVELLIVETGVEGVEQRALNVDQLMSFAHGIIIPGNPHSIDPALYGQVALNPDRADPNPNNYQFLARLINKAKLRGLPLLGICAGSWALNVAGNGSLLQKTPSNIHDKDPRDGTVAHAIDIYPSSRLFNMVKSTNIRVNSWHDQAVGRVADGMQVVAVACDGTVESFEGIYEPFLLGVQFHPEYLQTGEAGNSNFLSASELKSLTNIFQEMIHVGQQYKNKRSIVADTPTNEYLLERQRTFTFNYLTRNFRPTGEHQWGKAIQKVIDDLSVPETVKMLESQIAIIGDKATDLLGRKCPRAYQAATTLQESLELLKEHYRKGEMDYSKVKTEASIAIQQAREELEKHRGWKEILGNIALCILGLGIGYAAACAYRGSFFKFNTDSASTLTNIQKSIDHVSLERRSETPCL